MANESRSRVPLVAHSCTACGSEIAPTLLSCPSCHRLVHAERLKELAADAEAAEKAGELSAALTSWNEAVSLLPAESRQYAAVADRIAMLGRRVEAGPKPPGQSTPPAPQAKPAASSSSPWSGGAVSGLVATLALVAWKFKFLAVLFLTKGKILLLGLTKASTFLSMFVSMGVYWTVFGGWFAVGTRVVDLRPRDGTRRGTVALWDSRRSASVRAGPGCVHSLEARADRPETGRPSRVGRAVLGAGRRTRVPGGVRCHPAADPGCPGPVRGHHQPVQSAADLAPRRRTGLSQP